MTDRKELDNLIDQLRSRGGHVEVLRDDGGYPVNLLVAGLKGFGPFPMAPISFAERAREVLFNG